MAEIELKPFRWTDSGTLHLRVGDRVHLVVQGSIVEDPSELQALGGERIAGFVTEGNASYELEIQNELGELVREPVDPALEANRLEGEEVIQASLDENMEIKAGAQRVKKALGENFNLVREM